MGVKNIDIIQSIKSKKFQCNEEHEYDFDVNHLSFTFGYKDEIYFRATLIDQFQNEYQAIIKAKDNSEEILDKVVFIKGEDLVLFKTYKTNCTKYTEENESLSWS